MRTMVTVADREEISRGAEGLEYREIACRIGCDPSVVSREVARHGGRESYRCHRAEQAAVAARSRPKRLKVDRVPRLSAYVRHWLRRGWSPASVAGQSPIDMGEQQAVWVSHEAIYTWVYAQPVSTLDRNLIQLRSGCSSRRSGPRASPAPRIAEPAWIGAPRRGRGPCGARVIGKVTSSSARMGAQPWPRWSKASAVS